MLKAGKKGGWVSLYWGLWNSVNLILSSFENNLFAENYSDIFSSSKLAFKNNEFISLL